MSVRDHRGNGPRKYSLKLKINPPKDEPWAFLTIAMLESPAWRGLGINARKLIERLIIEHRWHGGLENGLLKCTHADLEEHGLSRNKIAEAIHEARTMGFIQVIQGGRYANGRDPNLYRLTFYGDHEGHHPTHEWKGITQELVQAWRKSLRTTRSSPAKKSFETPRTVTQSPPQLGVLHGSKGR